MTTNCDNGKNSLVEDRKRWTYTYIYKKKVRSIVFAFCVKTPFLCLLLKFFPKYFIDFSFCYSPTKNFKLPRVYCIIIIIIWADKL